MDPFDAGCRSGLPQLVFEHLLVACKIGLVFVIPERPIWVRKSEARNDFAKELLLQAAMPTATDTVAGVASSTAGIAAEA